VCPVGNPVGNLCPWCGELLPQSKTKPRKYCSEAHEKAFKRAGCITQQEANKLKQLAIDYWLKRFNHNRAFSTFGRHDPFTELPRESEERRKKNKYCGACARPKIAVDSELGAHTEVPVPTKVLPEFRPFPPETPLFIGPLLKNGKRKRGRA
jgi:hypothetical protein